MKHISESKLFNKINKISIAENNLGDIGVGHLLNCCFIKHISSLNLSNNNIEPYGFNLLIEFESFNELSVLNLSRNNIDDNCMDNLGIQPGILRKLTELNLEGNSVENYSVDSFKKKNAFIKIIKV